MSSNMLFLGDTYLPKPYKVVLRRSVPYVFNLEAPITSQGKPIPEKINLVCRDEFIENTFDRLPIAVCLANNHIMDYGDQGFEDTISVLKKKNILFFGAGLPEQDFNNPLAVEISKKKIGLFGYCYLKHIEEIKRAGLRYSPAPMDFDLIKKDIQTNRNNFDRLVLHFHCGIQESNIPEVEHIKLARKIIDAGADCVIGHHAHVIQPVEKYKNGIIAYGLGDFIFNDLKAPRNFNGAGNSYEFYSKKQRKWNRSSLGLNIDFGTMKYDIEYYFFDGEQVIHKKNFFHRYATYEIPYNLNQLQCKATKHHKMNDILLMIFRYLDRPKIPSFKGFLNAIKLCLKKN